MPSSYIVSMPSRMRLAPCSSVDGRVLHHEAAQRVGHRQHLEDADAARCSRCCAHCAQPFAWYSVTSPSCAKRREAQLLDHLGQRRVRLLAVRAQRAHEPLREDADHRRREQVVLDAHVEQAVHRRRRVVGVQGRQHQVAGERRLHGDLRGLEVADLADHDDVRVLAHDRAQRVAKVRPICGFTWIWLMPASWYSTGSSTVRIFTSGWLSAVERGVERGRLAAAGRPGDQQDAVRLHQRVDEALERVVGEAELREVERDAALVEDPQHDALAVHRRHGRDAQVDLLALHAQLDAAVLRQPALGDVEVRHDLDARDHRGRRAGAAATRPRAARRRCGSARPAGSRTARCGCRRRARRARW